MLTNLAFQQLYEDICLAKFISTCYFTRGGLARHPKGAKQQEVQVVCKDVEKRHLVNTFICICSYAYEVRDWVKCCGIYSTLIRV